MDASEADRRSTFTADVILYFREHAGEWIGASTLMLVGGRMAWRTRVSDARKVFKREHGVLENRQQRQTDGTVLSEYRYLSHTPLGRDAAMPTIQRELF